MPRSTRSWTTDGGGGAIRFVGLSRWSDRTDILPDRVDTGPADRYAAGSFRYRTQIGGAPAPHDGSATAGHPEIKP